MTIMIIAITRILNMIKKTSRALPRLFQKVDQWMNKDEQMDNEARKKLDDANQVGGDVDDGCSKGHILLYFRRSTWY